MKLLRWEKDGGPESYVDGLFVIEIKGLFSIVLLHFAPGSREAYHSHAFDSISWVLRGRLEERHLGANVQMHAPGPRPVVTRRETFHRVLSHGHTWVLTLRGPWARTWREYLPVSRRFITLEHGRAVREAA